MEKKRGIWHFVICVGLVCLIWGGYLLSVRQINQNNKVKHIRELTTTIDYDVLADIEQVDVQEDKLYISGWMFHRKEENIRLNVVLQPTDVDEVEVLEVAHIVRDDIRKKFDLQASDYGFKVEVAKKKLQEDRCYEVVLAFSYEDKAEDGNVDEIMKMITTNHFLYNGELYQYNPEEFDTPKLSDEYIQNVVKQGRIYAYDVDKKVWIYQFDDKLFCIADADYVVPLEKVPSVPMAFYTFFDDLIPEERQERYLQNGYDTYEIYLSEEHYVEGNQGGYYVVSLEMPEYPITYVCIGTYGNRGAGWISRNIFQMDIISD